MSGSQYCHAPDTQDSSLNKFTQIHPDTEQRLVQISRTAVSLNVFSYILINTDAPKHATYAVLLCV